MAQPHQRPSALSHQLPWLCWGLAAPIANTGFPAPCSTARSSHHSWCGEQTGLPSHRCTHPSSLRQLFEERITTFLISYLTVLLENPSVRDNGQMVV